MYVELYDYVNEENLCVELWNLKIGYKSILGEWKNILKIEVGRKFLNVFILN